MCEACVIGAEGDLDAAAVVARAAASALAPGATNLIEQLLRDSGHFGPAVEVPDDASAQDKLVGFVGRDPAWRP